MADFEQELEDLVRDGESLISQVRRAPNKGGSPPRGGGKVDDPAYQHVVSNLHEMQEHGKNLTDDLDNQTRHLGRIQGLLDELEGQITHSHGKGNVHDRLHQPKQTGGSRAQNKPRIRQVQQQEYRQQQYEIRQAGVRSNSADPMNAMRKQLGRLRVQLLTLESENKRLRKSVSELETQLYEARRMQRHAEDNFRVSTQRKFDLQSAKQFYDAEIDELSTLIDLVVDDQCQLRDRLTSQCSTLTMQFEELSSVAKVRHRKQRGFRDACVALLCKKLDLELMRRMFQFWAVLPLMMSPEKKKVDQKNQKQS